MATIILEYTNSRVTVPHFKGALDKTLERELFAAVERVLGRKPDRMFVRNFDLTMEQPAPASKPQSADPDAEPAEKAVCRWCKGKREITVNFKTRPCDCVKEDGTVGQADVGVGWKVKKTFTVSA